MQIIGFPEEALLLAGEFGASAPVVEVDFAPARAIDEWFVRDDDAELPILGGSVLSVRRDPPRAVAHTRLSPDRIAHSLLAAVGAVFGRWAGRDGFHAGVFAVGGRAWALLGHRGAGKTSLLARLALGGHDVLSDDLLLTDGERAFSGARGIDLRPDAAEQLGITERTVPARGTDRCRLPLGPVAPDYPLCGWILLGAPGADAAIRPLRPAERIALVAEHVMLNLPPIRPETLLALAALPAFAVSRPEAWSSEDRLLDQILSAVEA